eukprot:g11205.t1
MGNEGPDATLTRKVRKVLQLRPDLLREDLKCLSKFVTENNAHSRRNMRTVIEQQNLKVHERFIERFQPVERMLESLDNDIEELAALADKAATELADSRRKTRIINEEANRLREKRQIATEKVKICSAFLKKFRLPEEDLDRIRNAEHPIDGKFFAALEKVEEIRRNCQRGGGTFGGVGDRGGSMLEGGDDGAASQGGGRAMSSVASTAHQQHGHAASLYGGGGLAAAGTMNGLLNQTSAFDVIQETQEILDVAFERLFVSVQQQCRRLATTSADFMKLPSQNLKKSLQYLKDRPVYFNHCLRDIAKMRKQLLNARFHEALSRGDHGARPIEMCRSYDPVRYVGDILAWIHENIATEKEALTTFLGISIKRVKPPLPGAAGKHHHADGTATEISNFDGMSRAEVLSSIVNYNEAVQNDDGLLADLTSILDFVLEGLLDSFKSRIESLFQLPGLGTSHCYKISRLMSYFKEQLLALLHEKNRLVELLRLFHQKMMAKFLEICDQNSQRMREEEVRILDDLSCPVFVNDTVTLMDEIVADVEEYDEFHGVLCAVYDPLLNYCRQMFPSDACDRAVFLMNCLSLMVQPLKRTAFAKERVVLYEHLMQEQQAFLVEHQTSEVLQKLGLLEKTQALEKLYAAKGWSKGSSTSAAPPPALTMAELQAVPELHPVGLSSVLRTFYTSLFTLKTLSLPHVEKISHRVLREKTRRDVCEKIGGTYGFLYDGIEPLGITTHTKDQVAMLLDPGGGAGTAG